MSRGPAWYAQKAGRRDANHKRIVDGLRKLGHFVVETASVGGGVPDLCVYRRGRWVFPEPVWLELKTAKGRERASQVAWREAAEARPVLAWRGL